MWHVCVLVLDVVCLHASVCSELALLAPFEDHAVFLCAFACAFGWRTRACACTCAVLCAGNSACMCLCLCVCALVSDASVRMFLLTLHLCLFGWLHCLRGSVIQVCACVCLKASVDQARVLRERVCNFCCVRMMVWLFAAQVALVLRLEVHVW